jgi:hypothetical protein
MVMDDEGDVFFLHEDSGESQWTAPLDVEGYLVSRDHELSQGWQRVGPDEEGDIFYVNEMSGESVWERPTTVE